MQHNLPATLVTGLFLFASSAFAAEKPSEIASSEAAKEDAEKWLTGLGKKGLVLKETSKEAAFVGKYHAGVKSTSFQFNQDGWWLTVGFSGKVSAATSLKELQKKLTFVALDKLPTPGLGIPGWEIKPKTPTSRIKKGIEVVTVKDGTLTLRVKTKCFALYGTDPKAMRRVPADAGAPKSAYFQIRKPFPLDLTLTAPLKVEDSKKK